MASQSIRELLVTPPDAGGNSSESPRSMEGGMYCAYNVTRSCSISSKVTIVDKTDQPLTILRLLVEGLGFKAATSLWLNPLHGPPQLVRPFPFDLVYLDANMRVIEAVELLPEVSFPAFDDAATSALILPVRTISSSGLQKGDELVICSKDELEGRFASATKATALVAVTPAPASAPPKPAVSTMDSPPATTTLDDVEPLAPVQPEMAVDEGNAPSPAPAAFLAPVAPMIPFNPGVFVATETSTTTQGAVFKPSVSTTWQVPVSTTAVAPENTAAKESPADNPAFSTEPPISTAEHEVSDRPGETAVPDVAVPAKAASQAGTGAEGRPDHLAAPLSGSVEAHKEKQSESSVSTAPPVQVPIAKREESRAPSVVTPKAAAPVRKPESTRENVARAVRTSALEVAQPKASDRKKKKHSFGDLVKDFLNCPDPPPEYRDAARLVQQGMIAQDKSDSTSTWMDVRDVSPSGIYLRARTRWKPGDVVFLGLQQKGATEDEFESHVDVHGKVVRRDEGGVGLAWVLPAGVDFQPWNRLHTKRSDESDIQYFIRELRFAKAMHFLQKICPLASQEIRHAFNDRLSNKRVSSAVEIALQAQKALAPGKGSKILAHSDVLMKIIESGSWIEDNWIRKMWAGLLVSSCDADGQDTSNLTFIDLLARLTPMHLRILSFVCQKFDDAVTAGTAPAKLDVFCTAEELTIAADSHSFARIQQTVGQLSGVGLLVEGTRPSYFSVSDKEKTRTTPTAMGLKMYARCHGRRV